MGKKKFFKSNRKELYITMIVCGIIIFAAILWSVGYSIATNSSNVAINSNKVDQKEENKNNPIENEKEDKESNEKNEDVVNKEDEDTKSETSDEESTDDSSDNSGNETVDSISEENEVEAHEHIWENITEKVFHEEEGHFEDILVKEEVVNKVPIYEVVEKYICNVCNGDITNSDIESHLNSHNLDSGYRTEETQVQVGTKDEVTPAVYEKKWIVDKEAWSETVVTGKKCQTCGVTQ